MFLVAFAGRNFEILSEKDRYGLYVPVVICKDCGLIQTNPRMTQEAYNQFYDIEYRKLYGGKDTPADKDDFFNGSMKHATDVLREIADDRLLIENVPKVGVE